MIVCFFSWFRRMTEAIVVAKARPDTVTAPSQDSCPGNL
jgi:hypothetical protein